MRTAITELTLISFIVVQAGCAGLVPKLGPDIAHPAKTTCSDSIPVKITDSDKKVLATGGCRSGKRDSTWTVYDTSGRKILVSNWKNGARNGEERVFSSKDQVMVEGTFVEGKRSGPFSILVDGKTIVTETYTDGKLASREEFYADGKPRSRQEYLRGDSDYTWQSWDEQGGQIESAEFRNGKLAKGFAPKSVELATAISPYEHYRDWVLHPFDARDVPVDLTVFGSSLVSGALIEGTFDKTDIKRWYGYLPIVVGFTGMIGLTSDGIVELFGGKSDEQAGLTESNNESTRTHQDRLAHERRAKKAVFERTDTENALAVADVLVIMGSELGGAIACYGRRSLCTTVSIGAAASWALIFLFPPKVYRVGRAIREDEREALKPRPTAALVPDGRGGVASVVGLTWHLR